MSEIQKEGLSRACGGVRAIHGIALQVDEKGVVGPSDCGKSATLWVIAGLEGISGGSPANDGRVMNRVAPRDRDVAMVFENDALCARTPLARAR